MTEVRSTVETRTKLRLITGKAMNDPTPKYTVLAIDDEVSILSALRRGIGRNFNLICKDSIKDAFIYLNSTTTEIDCIITDYRMPEMSGVEVVRLIRSIEHYAHVPIVMLTGNSSEDIELLAFEEGVSDFVAKPFSNSLLTSRLLAHCKRNWDHRNLESLAYHDPLTGLENRRRMTHQFNKEMDRCRRAGQDFSIAFLDIDHFKKINDRYGHDAGDIVLKQIAKTFQEHFKRPTDHFFRFGGEEFLLMVSETSGSSVEKQLEVCVDNLQNLNIYFGGEKLEIDLTLSGGCITISADMEPRDQESILKEADKLLYKAKETRNRRIWQRWERPEITLGVSAK